MRIERSGGKQFGFSENLPQLEDMRDALASVGESTVLVDAAIQSAMDRTVSKIDQAAMSVGTLNERFKGQQDRKVFLACHKDVEHHA